MNFDPKPQSGFSLLEVMITISILLTLVVGVSFMLRSSIDLKTALARDARVTHRLSMAITRVTWDIEHAFIVGLNDTARGGSERRFRTIFKIEKSGDNDKLLLTTSGNMQGMPGMPDSDTAYVVYEVKDDPETPGRKHLYRGVSLATREDLKEDPPMRLFVRDIKVFKISPWRGDDWSTDRWDSTRLDWRDRLPTMVRVEIETWNEDDELRLDILDAAEQTTASVKTVVAIQQARQMKEIKQPTSSIRWY